MDLIRRSDNSIWRITPSILTRKIEEGIDSKSSITHNLCNQLTSEALRSLEGATTQSLTVYNDTASYKVNLAELLCDFKIGKK